MTTQVNATFANGVLTPDTPLPFAEQTRVRVTLEPVPTPAGEVPPIDAFVAWIAENPLNFGGAKYTRNELYERD